MDRIPDGVHVWSAGFGHGLYKLLCHLYPEFWGEKVSFSHFIKCNTSRRMFTIGSAALPLVEVFITYVSAVKY